MPFELPLPAALAGQRWKVKIREKERLEPPHVTVIRGTVCWRIDLRAGGFMDGEPDPAVLPKQLVELIEQNLERLRAEWDKRYPLNPVSGGARDD